MSIFKYLTLSHLQKVLAALEVKFLGINNEISEIKEDVDKVEIELGKIDIKQSDWEERDSADGAYILNKPAIKTGTGENSVLIGQIEQDSEAATYTIYVTGDANATTYSYTTTDTLPGISNLVALGYAEYLTNVKPIKSCDLTNRTITFYTTLSSTALSNAEVYIQYKQHTTSGDFSYSEGSLNNSSGTRSHSEGYGSFAIGSNSHAEGSRTRALGTNSHAEGAYSVALSANSHAEGMSTIAQGLYSHAEGNNTITSNTAQHVQGKYNIEDINGIYADIVGNGTSSTPSNAYTLDWNGNGWYAGKLTVGAAPTNDMDVATKQYVDDNAKDLFITTVTSTTTDGTTTYSFDKTFTEITTAYNAGKVCIARDSASTYYLSFINSSTIRFIYILISTSANIQIQSGVAFEINSSNVVTRTNKNWYSTSSIKNICVEKEAIGKVNGTYSWVTGTGTFSETAYQNYSEGDLFWRTNTELVKAITDISSGDTFTENTNYIVTTIDDELKLKPDFNDVLTKTNTTSYTPIGDYNPATKKYVDDKSLMVVTVDSGDPDKTFSEILAHLNNGGTAVLHYGGSAFQLEGYSSYGLDFYKTEAVDDSSEGIYDTWTRRITINTNNTWRMDDIWVGRHPSNQTPQPLGTTSPGISNSYARADHVHSLPTLSISGNTITLTGAAGSTSSITLPVYNGGVSS